LASHAAVPLPRPFFLDVALSLNVPSFALDWLAAFGIVYNTLLSSQLEQQFCENLIFYVLESLLHFHSGGSILYNKMESSLMI
jgi:hypothetical protein